MNKVILMGRLTRDPEVRYTQTNNTLVASFSLAVNRRFTRPGEERQKRYVTEVVAEEAYFADSKREGADVAGFENTFGSNVANSSSPEFEVTSSDDLPF